MAVHESHADGPRSWCVRARPCQKTGSFAAAVAMLAMACTPAGTELHTYGYNWSPREAERHPMWSEHVSHEPCILVVLRVLLAGFYTAQATMGTHKTRSNMCTIV